MATSATTSVSGLGMSTRGSTMRSRPRNAHRPSTYWSGSPVRRRSTRAASRAARSGGAGSDHRDRSRPLTSSTSHRASTSEVRAAAPAWSSRHVTGRSVYIILMRAGPCPPASSDAEQSGPRPMRSARRSGELGGAVGFDQGVEQLVEVAGQHLVELVDREPDAVVGHPVLLEVVRADLLRPAAAADLGPPGARQLVGLALLLGLEEAGPEDPHGLVLVLELALLVLAGDDDA